MNKNLLILGAGQYGTVVKEIAREMDCFERIDFLDDTFGMGETEGNYHEQSIGKLNDYSKFSVEYTYAIVSIGDANVRKQWTERLKESCYTIPIIVSPRAYISNSAQVQSGCVVEPLAGIHANAVIGSGTFVSMGAVVNHNSFVGDYCHVDCNAVIMSGGFVSNKSYVDAGEIIRKVPLKFTIDNDGIHAEKMPITPTDPGWNFDDVM